MELRRPMEPKTVLAADGLSRPLEPAERDELAAFLSSVAVGPTCLALEGLDGFLCALAAGPEPLPAAEWLPWAWGSDKEPHYDSDAQAQRIVVLMLRQWNSVRDRVPKNPVTGSGSFAPWLADTPVACEYGQRWASGFMRGMSPYQDDWMGGAERFVCPPDLHVRSCCWPTAPIWIGHDAPGCGQRLGQVVRLNEDAVRLERPSHRADRMSMTKGHRRLSADLLQLRTMHLQPEPLRALPISQQSGFGESIRHGVQRCEKLRLAVYMCLASVCVVGGALDRLPSGTVRFITYGALNASATSLVQAIPFRRSVLSVTGGKPWPIIRMA
jgi:yecA family protein